MCFFGIDQVKPMFLTNSDLQFQTKFEISGSQNQYSGNKMLQEPVKSRQDMSFTANTLKKLATGCGDFVDFELLSYCSYLILADPSFYREKDAGKIIQVA
jgi:hypothetical protein